VIAVFLELLDFGIGHKVAHYALGVAVVNA
jgi:hypothetical protein